MAVPLGHIQQVSYRVDKAAVGVGGGQHAGTRTCPSWGVGTQVNLSGDGLESGEVKETQQKVREGSVVLEEEPWEL